MNTAKGTQTVTPFDPTPWIAEDHLSAGLAARPHRIPDDIHNQIIDRVARMYQAMVRDGSELSAPYRVEGEWAVYLAERKTLYDDLLANRLGPAGERLAHFWRNELGPIVKEYARYDQLAGRVEPFVSRFQHNVVRNYLIWREIVDHPLEALASPQVGNPWGYMIDGHLVAPKATRFHALAVQAAEMTRGLDCPVIAEIGGGYGGLAYYLLQVSPTCTYIDFDLPETLVLAAYYLLCAAPGRPVLLYGEDTAARIGPPAGGVQLLPHFALPTLAERSVDLMINTFSLSEVPWTTLLEYMDQIHRCVRHYFLHNNMDRAGVVNRGYERIPSTRYPIDREVFKQLYKDFDLFHGHDGDYRQVLYQRIS